MKSICSPPAAFCLLPTAVVGGEEGPATGSTCRVGGGSRDLRYFPTQNVEKMISKTSSTYVAPVI
jgi:hypothetical protein